MEERKLNLNAPFLSVRRIATTPVIADREKEKIVQRPDGRHSLPPYKSDFCLEQVTEPVAVPFHWEHIPGKAKVGKEAEATEEVSVTPRLPPGKLINVTKQSSERDHGDQNGARSPHFNAYSTKENVKELKCSKEVMNQRGASESEDEDDIYSDALETISPTKSFSLNCSASCRSQSHGADAKSSIASAVDPQTRDFLMNRFLPAAKAMALETPHAAKKQHTAAPEQPRQITRVIREDTRPLPKEQRSQMELQHRQYEEEEESEGEDDEYDASGSVSAKGCGLFPRLCLRNSLCLLGPIPGMKVKTRALTSSSSGVARPEKSAYGRSLSQPLNKHAWDAAYKRKSNCGVQSGELLKLDNKKAGESNRFTHSGDLKKGSSSPFGNSRRACVSPYRNRAPCGVKSAELQKFDYNQAGESSRFTLVGDLTKGRLSPLRHSRSACISPYRNGAPCGVKSAELQKFDYNQASESSRLTLVGDLTKGRLSPLRHSRSACISPYQNGAPCGVKSAELQKFEYKKARESSHFTHSGDLKKGTLSSLRHSRSACISPYRNEAPHGVHSAELQKFEYKQACESSRRTHSGDLNKGRLSPLKHSRRTCITSYPNEAPRGFHSAELQKFEHKQACKSSCLTNSGDLNKGRSSPFRHSRSTCISPYRSEAPRGVHSAELQKFEYKRVGESSRFTHAGDLNKSRSSPFRHSRSGCISPYRNEAPKSPFPVAGFLGVPREENTKANSKFNLHKKGGHSSQEVTSLQRNNQGPGSESPIVEKTLYVDTVNVAKLSYLNSSSFDIKEQVDCAGEDFETLLKRREMEETFSAESPFQDIKCLNNFEGGGKSETEVFESVDDKSSSLCDIPHFKGQIVAMKDSLLGIGQETEAFNYSNSGANGNLDTKSGQIIPVQSLLPPPLPRSPSESWLWSTLSSISSRNSFSHAHTKRLELETSSMSTKWETIVKTSNLRHDHMRYSEELITHFSQQS
ncbi:uncharacterized protein [Pyrus communis]|uniref:uncharacterized protein n=1 Tax=Pyrus communis TaxID=23211 RepID=UPI0035C0F692